MLLAAGAAAASAFCLVFIPKADSNWADAAAAADVDAIAFPLLILLRLRATEFTVLLRATGQLPPSAPRRLL